jgi:hypothetical protein
MLNPSILQVSFAGQTKIVLNFNDSPVGYDSSDALPGTTHLDWAILRFVLCKPVAFLSNLAVQSMNRSELCTHFLKSKICRCSYSHDMVAFARLHIAVLAVLSKNCLVYEILVANSHLYYSG